jgi:hypothetical protein
MSSLFELTGQYLEIKKMAEQGVDDDVIQDTIESLDLETDIEDKADSYAALIRHLKGNTDMLDKEIKRLNEMKGKHKRTIEKLNDNLYNAFKAIGKQELKTDKNVFKMKKNPISLIVEKEDFIPKEFFTEEVTRKLNKDELKKQLKKELDENGTYSLEGVRLEQKERLDIK